MASDSRCLQLGLFARREIGRRGHGAEGSRECQSGEGLAGAKCARERGGSRERQCVPESGRVKGVPGVPESGKSQGRARERPDGLKEAQEKSDAMGDPR